MGCRGLGEGHCQHMSQPSKNQLGGSRHILYHHITWDQSFSGFECVVPNIWMGGRGLGKDTVSTCHRPLKINYGDPNILYIILYHGNKVSVGLDVWFQTSGWAVGGWGKGTVSTCHSPIKIGYGGPNILYIIL